MLSEQAKHCQAEEIAQFCSFLRQSGICKKKNKEKYKKTRRRDIELLKKIMASADDDLL